MLDPIARLRRFNRVVTREIGALDTSYLGRGRPLGVARVLHLVKPGGTDVAELRLRLGLDTGLLSRILRGLKNEGLIHLATDPADRRRRIVRLTPEGQAEWQIYDQLGYAKAQAVFDRAGTRQQALIDAMDLIATVMLQDQVEIRDADPDDPAALACVGAYYRLLMETFPDFTPDMFPLPLPDATRCRPPLGACLVAWSDDLPVGCVSLRPLGNGVAEVKRLWVDPVARGQGLARRLMRSIETRAVAQGFTDLRLDSHTDLAPAIALYRNDGWVEIAPYTGYPANIWMAKRLRPRQHFSPPQHFR
ncbi:helix-turn-helix domain-containing GNAT family N-acetyltransferase [Tabrizicola sp.]|uniref:bifunctional helix-turn-helix transcriptional regulator/GNAT family N-acetyltransferase n=1 Tax=Tabrizicola sp. TaxID=2005166 RepID=UPI00286CBD09|nr:helix-turn-helix domain-containing GNAT family N-acetyltransferase [Tabrizicola sp.]